MLSNTEDLKTNDFGVSAARIGMFAVSVQAPPWSKGLFPAVRANVCEADKRDRRRERLSAKLTEGID